MGLLLKNYAVKYWYALMAASPTQAVFPGVGPVIDAPVRPGIDQSEKLAIDFGTDAPRQSQPVMLFRS